MLISPPLQTLKYACYEIIHRINYHSLALLNGASALLLCQFLWGRRQRPGLANKTDPNATRKPRNTVARCSLARWNRRRHSNGANFHPEMKICRQPGKLREDCQVHHLHKLAATIHHSPTPWARTSTSSLNSSDFRSLYPSALAGLFYGYISNTRSSATSGGKRWTLSGRTGARPWTKWIKRSSSCAASSNDPLNRKPGALHFTFA